MRFEMQREFYIPKDAIPHPVDVDAAIFTYTAPNGKPAACAFVGKAKKPAWKFYFSNEEQRQRKIDEQVASCQARAKYKAELKAERSKPHTLTVGALLSSSWGYEQTNVDFYQVVRIIGPHTVELRAIGMESTGLTGNGMADHVVACPNSFRGEPFKARANSTNSVKANYRQHASPWDGCPLYRSWYA